MMTVADQIPDSTKSAAEYQPDAANQLADKLLQSIAFKVYSSDDDVIREAAAMLRTRAASPAMDREAEEKAFRQWWDNDRDPDASFPDREAFAFGYQAALSVRSSPIGIDRETARAALQRSYESWSNIIEMGIIPPQYRNNARQIADQCHEALSTLSADAIRQWEGDDWLPITDDAKSGALVELVVDYKEGEHPLADAILACTIGFNTLADAGVDEWKFAGWCWTHDHFVQGKGKPVAWRPSRLNAADEALPPLPATPASHASDGGK